MINEGLRRLAILTELNIFEVIKFSANKAEYARHNEASDFRRGTYRGMNNKKIYAQHIIKWIKRRCTPTESN